MQRRKLKTGVHTGEVGSFADLQAYHADKEKEWTAPNLQDPEVMPNTCETTTQFGAAYAKLRASEYLVCISDRVNEYELYPFEGCDELLGQVLDSISQGHSVLVVGQPGTGKRTLSLGLARRFAALRQSSRDLHGIYSRSVYTLSLGSSFCDRADEDVLDLQEKICEVFRLVEEVGPEKLVLCIDDIDVLAFIDRVCKEQRQGQGDSGSLVSTRDVLSEGLVSAENLLRFLLFSKKVLCLCTCIQAAYQHLTNSDSYYDVKFTMSFRVLHMEEPGVVQTLQILRSHRKRIERENGVIVIDDAMRTATAYAQTFMSHQAMPKKAIELVQEACRCAITEKSKKAGNSGNMEVDRSVMLASSAELASTGGGNSAVVDKRYVDELIRKWCGISDRQLRGCLDKHGMVA